MQVATALSVVLLSFLMAISDSAMLEVSGATSRSYFRCHTACLCCLTAAIYTSSELQDSHRNASPAQHDLH